MLSNIVLRTEGHFLHFAVVEAMISGATLEPDGHAQSTPCLPDGHCRSDAPSGQSRRLGDTCLGHGTIAAATKNARKI